MTWEFYHERYEELPESIKAVVDKSFESVIQICKDGNMVVAMDDRAEELVAAITKFILDSVV